MRREKVKSNYTQVPNQIIQNSKLSIGARFLYSYLLSLHPDLILYKSSIGKMDDIGMSKNTALKYWEELEKKAYIRQGKLCYSEPVAPSEPEAFSKLETLVIKETEDVPIELPTTKKVVDFTRMNEKERMAEFDRVFGS